ncbi:Pimeloyl-ACP methyl ester carboxylesterase [Sphingomonas sp. OV641]|uniref:alpha/beta fold hydrolase n=1 Tax=Sphingomonas sp. OV641 TaxID=1881068 RepID=UPI0008BCD1CA|nr:alpha/beta hydrolase [Sphingomonas sp. OV641]SEJ58179.1 Pimeloyl-ACP methyl ester carboxylesterase [Sphingomonas sp. OV641]
MSPVTSNVIEAPRALAEAMPPVQFVETNGIRMAYYEVGPKGEGVPVIFCHGFPELAFSWRHQLDAFDKAGRWAIAPDQRGYGLTSRPEKIEDYDLEQLTADIAGMMDALGIEKAIPCGHDWGGMVVWQFALRYPERCAGVIGVNTPFLPRGDIDPIAGMRAAFGEDMYIVWFQKPGEADAALAADPERSMRFFMRKPMLTLKEYEQLPAEMRTLALGEGLKLYDPANDPQQFLTDDEIEAFAQTFAETGFTGGINWYRNFTRNWQNSAKLVEKVDVPSLMVMAENDVVLSPAMTEGMERYVPDLERVLVEKSGHWTQQEFPEEVNRALIGWLDKRFPR